MDIIGRAARKPNQPRLPKVPGWMVGKGRSMAPQIMVPLMRYSAGSRMDAVLVTMLALNPAGIFQNRMTAVHTAKATQGSSSTLSRRPGTERGASAVPRGRLSSSSGGTSSASTISRTMYSAMEFRVYTAALESSAHRALSRASTNSTAFHSGQFCRPCGVRRAWRNGRK